MNRYPYVSSSLRVAKTLAVLTGLAALTACNVSTIARRSNEKAATFAAATPKQKQVMQDGWLDAGFTTDMVYIALGQPDQVVPATDGFSEIWVYMNFASQLDSASLGKGKVTATMVNGVGVRGAVTDTTGRMGKVEFNVAPDVGSAAPAEEIPRLYVQFFQGKAISIKLKKA